ncbi:ATP-binding protein [Allokutzneria multivorans]|uniref:ATP-binding protein n=1 Tax=Allokutzneria multivorans TaxID=1142134 RepID=A0ABP7R7P4_9PSEU
MFVNRVDELAALERWWLTGRQLAVVWGRRRVGKTALLHHFARDLRSVFHTGAGRSARAELVQLARQVAATQSHRLRDLTARPYTDWDDALEDLALLATDEPLLVVLDEFPELVKGSPELPGVIRALFDRVAGRTKLRLLLCGSAVRRMEMLQEERAPLYGRFDISLLVHPFQPHEAALLLPSLAASDRALVYGLLGGVPLYLSWWDSSADVTENLLRLVARPGAPLLTEGQLVLATEAEHGDQPSAVLHAVASGATRYGQIKDTLGAEPARTIERLIQLRLLEKREPVTERGRTKKVSYRVSDNFLAFYLGVLSRFRSEIEGGLGESILPVLLGCLGDFMGERWEEMFRAHLRRLAVAGEIAPEIVAVGQWWNDPSNVEIDALVLAGRARKVVMAGEAKWAKSPDAERVLRSLRTKAAAVPGVDPEQIGYAVATREQPRSAPAGALLVTANDILG